MSIDIGMKSVFDFLANHPSLLIAAFLVYIFVFFISVFFHGRKPGKNPLAQDFRRAPEPFVHDTKARDAILKQRFKVGKVPENLDAIIIGSGIGGLTAGALLSRAGKKVLVLEQHDQAGGCCHSFVEKGFEFDTGIHYVGGMHDGSINRTLLDQITCGQLRWTKMGDEYDTVALGPSDKTKKFPMKSGKARYIQNLVDMFPQEKAAIHQYMEIVVESSKTFMGLVMMKVLPKFLVRFLVNTGLYKLVFACYRKGFVSRSLQDVLDSLTDNKELKLVLSYICGDYGVLPKKVPFILHAILITHYLEGAYYPTGGTSEIAFHISQVIQNAGGRVLMQALVTKILCNEKGQAVGVRVGKTETDIFGKYIISDAGASNTFKRLLPESVAKKSYIYPLIDKVGPSCSFFTVFVGLDGSPSELKIPAGNTWHYHNNDINTTMEGFLNEKKEDLDELKVPFLYISFPATKDAEWEEKYPGKSTVLIITLAKWEWFDEWQEGKLRHRGERYEGIKDVLGRQMWNQCVELFPQLDGKMMYMEVGTPVTNQHYLACQVGEMYGLSQEEARFSADVWSKLRPDTDVPGLYLTGQDTMTCGFTSALVMGLICSGTILNRNVYGDLQKLQKSLNAIDGKNGLLKKKD